VVKPGVPQGTYARQVPQTSGTTGIRFVKGHGTGNDFIIVPDLSGTLTLSPEWVRAACSRRTGLGADGVIRVVRSGADTSLAWAGDADFVMDYRNADGSIAEMCGNGARVMMRYLLQAGLITDAPVTLATRGGPRQAWIEQDTGHGNRSHVTINMGSAVAGPESTVSSGGHQWPALGVYVPNPHAVVLVPDLREIPDLRQAPILMPDSAFPEGVNVEFVQRHSPSRLTMRVYERGVGETMACGTGACAVAWALGSLPEGSVSVEQPGGIVQISMRGNGDLLLTGPAELVASGDLNLS